MVGTQSFASVINHAGMSRPVTPFLSDKFPLSFVEIEIGVETVDNWTEMSTRQATIAGDAVNALKHRAATLGERSSWIGGMRYQAIKGHEYLVRYYTDDKAGRKLVTSLGRRSPSTDRALSEFEAGRAAWKIRAKANDVAVDESARLLKAMRIGRLPREIRDAIEILNDHDLLCAPDYYDAWFVAGTTALLAYELERRIVFSPDLVGNADGPTLDLATCGEPEAEAGRLFQVFPDAVWIDACAVKLKNGPTIRLHQIAEDLIPYVRWIGSTTAVGGLPMQSQIIVGRDGNTALAPVLSPFTFVSVELARETGSVHRRRAEAVASLYNLGLTFEPVDNEVERVPMRPG